MKLFFFSILILFCSASCQDAVQVKLDEGSELIVIDAFLESKYDAQAIFIHKNSSYFNTQDPEPIIDAQVTLYDLTSGASFKFHYAREDRYEVFAEHETFKAGHQYKLEVSVDGFIYSALTIQPRAAKIDSIGAQRYTSNQITGEATPPYYLCTLWAKDKADNNPDYYWIKVNPESEFIDLCIDGTGGIVTNAGQDSIYFTAPYNQLGFQVYAPGSFCHVEVVAIARDTYQFLVQAQAQISNGGMFATTPENVKTNFITPSEAKKKAVGWFSVGNIAEGSRTIPF